MTETAALGLKVTPEGFDATNVILAEFARKTDQASVSADKLSGKMRDSKGRFIGAGQGAEEAAKGIDKLGGKIGKTTGLANMLAANLGKLTGLLAGAFSIGAAGRMADNWSDMQSRVGAAVKDMSAAPAIMKRLVEMSNATYSSLDQTVGAFAGNIGAFTDMGRSAEDAMNYTEALNHALVITATKGEQAASVQMHLAKAMDLGKLSGEGLDAVLANGGRVAQALAKELNTNVGSLRKFSSEGKITSQVIANALTKELGNLRKEAAEMPATMADGFTRMGTNLTAFVGQMDQALGVSGTVAEGIMFLADNIDILAGGVAGIAAGIATFFIPSMVTGVASLATMTAGFIAGTTAATAFKVALAGTGIGLVILAVGGLATMMFKLIRATGSLSEAWELFKEIASGVWDYIAASAAAVPHSLSGVWHEVRRDFYAMVAELLDSWSGFLKGMGLDTLGAGAASLATGAWGDSWGAQQDSVAAYAEADKIKADGLVNLTAALDKMKAASEAAGKALAGAGGDGNGGAAGAIKNTGGAAKKASKDVDDFTKVMKGLNGELALLQATQGMSDLDKAIYGKQQEAGVKPGSIGGIAIDEAMRTIDTLKKVEEAGKRGAEAVSGIFTSMLDGSKKLKQGVADLLMEMAKVQMQKAILGLGGSGGLLGSAFSWLGGMLTPNAKGGVYDSPGLSAYSGSVVSSPTVFPFAKGAGLMGEAGPEAILPLKRGADGKLGVQAGAGGGAGGVDVNVTVSVDEEGQLMVRSIAQRESQATVGAFSRRALGDRMQQIQANPRRRG